MVKQWKIEAAEKLAEEIKSSPVVGLIKLNKIPTKQMQLVRKQLKDRAKIKVTKNAIIKHALDKVKEKIELKEKVDGPTAIIMSDVDAFRLFKELKSIKSRMLIKPGEEAPEDITVPAGDTGIPPGPGMTDLKQAGLPVKIESGSVHISKDTVILKKGERASAKIASALAKLGIEPIEIYVRPTYIWDGGIIFDADTLDVNVEEILANVTNAHERAFRLAYSIKYFTPETVELFVKDAYKNALNLAVNAGIVNDKTAKYILMKAQSEALALAAKLPEEVTGVKVDVPVAKEEEGGKEEQQEKEEEKEDNAVAGLGALFG